MVFDLLELDGRVAGAGTVRAAARAPGRAPARTPSAGGCTCRPIFDGDLEAALDTSRAARLEGVVAKRHGSVYQPGRRGAHLAARSSCCQPGGGHRRLAPRAGSARRLDRARCWWGSPRTVVCATSAGSGPGSTAAGRRRHGPPADARPARTTSPFAGVPREDARDAYWVRADPGRRGDLHRAHRSGAAAAPGVEGPAPRQDARRGRLGVAGGSTAPSSQSAVRRRAVPPARRSRRCSPPGGATARSPGAGCGPWPAGATTRRSRRRPAASRAGPSDGQSCLRCAGSGTSRSRSLPWASRSYGSEQPDRRLGLQQLAQQPLPRALAPAPRSRRRASAP